MDHIIWLYHPQAHNIQEEDFGPEGDKEGEKGFSCGLVHSPVPVGWGTIIGH